MARRIAVQSLNASTIDILNVIRQNAGYEYQSMVPEVKQATDIPKVGEVIYGTPAIANRFLNELINRIALVSVKSATFNNPYARLKKGYLEFGETIEEIFVNIAKVVEYTPEKGAQREFKRTLPDVRTAFHTINWRVMYPVTIQDEDLKQAFLSLQGVQDLIAKIVDSVYTAAQYDEFLLFKYMLIKALAHGKIKAISVSDTENLKEDAISYRGLSNLLPFMSTNYNEAGVLTTTPKERQLIFMDAMYNAKFDVEILASAFNMDKANFMGSLYIIDSFSTFDNARFEVIRQNSDGIEEVTEAELALLESVNALIVDEEWFQVYDNNNKFTEKYVASGLYWNYFYHTWKTVSRSPFANAIAFVSGAITPKQTVDLTVTTVDKSEDATVIGLTEKDGAEPTLGDSSYNMVQTENATKAGIGIQPYGAVLIPKSQEATEITLEADVKGEKYTASAAVSGATTVGTDITLAKATAPTTRSKGK